MRGVYEHPRVRKSKTPKLQVSDRLLKKMDCHSLVPLKPVPGQCVRGKTENHPKAGAVTWVIELGDAGTGLKVGQSNPYRQKKMEENREAQETANPVFTELEVDEADRDQLLRKRHARLGTPTTRIVSDSITQSPEQGRGVRCSRTTSGRIKKGEEVWPKNG